MMFNITIGKRSVVLAIFLLTLSFSQALAAGDGKGQEDLDQAMVKRLNADSMEKLNEVSKLLQQAIDKGLDKENEGFAKQMLSGVALEQGKEVAQEMFSQPRGRNLGQLRSKALEYLETSISNDPKQADAYMLIARLQALPGGDRKHAMASVTLAIKALDDDGYSQSKAYLLRAMMQDDADKRYADIDSAVKADPKNVEAYEARAMLHVRDRNLDKAVDDLMQILEIEPTNIAVIQAAVKTLAELDRSDDAIKILDEGLRSNPDASLYRLRAAVLRSQDKLDAALDDLNKSLELKSDDAVALMSRAEIYLLQQKTKEAGEDLDKAMELNPGSVQGILLRSYVAAEEKRLPDAINDMQMLVRSFPDNAAWAMQLATYYQIDNRPRRAIEVVTAVLAREPGNWRALRIRADNRLTVGEHKEAVADYEAALKTDIDSPDSKAGILNNLAWVLATSPEEKLRNGKRALKLALQAAELTENKQAHILSTVAAAYAEGGDFDNAVKWSQDAVDLGKDDDQQDQLDQLKQELESYKNKKPWREEQNVEENKAPIFSADELIDT